MEKCIITMLDHGESFDKGIAALKLMGIETVWEKDSIRSSRDPARVIPYVKGYDYVFAGGEIWNMEVFDACPDVKLIVRLGVGYEGIDLAAASAAGVPVTYMPGVNAMSVAEHALALLLAASRRIPYMDRLVHEGRRREAISASNTLYGKTVGILGCGNIGKALARMLTGFGCRILAYDVKPDAEFARELGVEFTDAETLLRQSDAVSVHLPLLPSTKHFINEDSIGLMKQGALLVNTSRGGTVDSAALAQALKSGRLKAAGLDVVEDEGGEKPGEIFYGLDNAILTPHVAGATHECFGEMMDAAVKTVEAFRRGDKLRNLLNPDYRR